MTNLVHPVAQPRPKLSSDGLHRRAAGVHLGKPDQEPVVASSQPRT